MKEFKFVELEPKRPNRFIVELVGTNLDSWAITEASRPTYTLEGGWEDIKIKVLDPIGPSSSMSIYSGIIEKGLRNRDIKIKLLDPTGVVVETWEISGNYKSVDFGRLDYGKDEFIGIILIFEIKTCKLS